MPSKDINVRANLQEWMDGPCTDTDLQGCLLDLEQVNRVVLVHRPTLHWLGKMAPLTSGPLHIVDVGCGSGDMLRAIEGWSARRGHKVRLTGVDMNARTVRIAEERSGSASSIQYLCGNAAEHPDVRDVDIIISSHLTHHLRDDEIITFLQWMENTASIGWFVNDLERERVPFHAFRLLASVMQWHPFIRHDGPLSVLRAFRSEDWVQYLSAAGIEGASIHKAFPGRLCVSRSKLHA